MFDKFGEMNSYEEINELAENLFNEGDLASLKEMAKENGIPEEFADLYIAGDIPTLCDAMIAANSKLDLECTEFKPKGIMLDWVEYIRGQCMEHQAIAIAVRKKGKSLRGCITELLRWSFKQENQFPIEKDILKAAGVTANRITLGIPDMGQTKKIIKDYYTGDDLK